MEGVGCDRCAVAPRNDFWSTKTVGPLLGGWGFVVALARSHTSEHYELRGKSQMIQGALPASELLIEEPSMAYGHQAQRVGPELSSRGTEMGESGKVSQRS